MRHRTSILLSAAIMLAIATPLAADELSFVFIAEDQVVGFPASTGQTDLDERLLVLEDTTEASVMHGIQALSMRLRHDPGYLDILAVTPGQAIQDLNQGQGPAYFAVGVCDGFVTIDSEFSLTLDPPSILPFDQIFAHVPQEVAVVTYHLHLASLTTPGAIETTLTWEDGAHCSVLPAVMNRVTSGDQLHFPAFDHGLLEFVPLHAFVRGDGNGDGYFDVSDVVCLIHYLFLEEAPVPTCQDACDLNDDGSLGLVDVIATLRCLFSEDRPEPCAPWPDCGVDPTPADGLDCEQYLPCP